MLVKAAMKEDGVNIQRRQHLANAIERFLSLRLADQRRAADLQTVAGYRLIDESSGRHEMSDL